MLNVRDCGGVKLRVHQFEIRVSELATLPATPTDDSGPCVCIILVNYQGWSDTVECVRSVQRSTYPNFEILIVDNGSREASCRQAERLGQNVEILWLRSNRGFAGGSNAGIRHALNQGVDYVFALNNDTVVAPDCLERLVAVAEADPQVGLVSPKVCYYGRPNVVWFAGAKLSLWRGGAYHLGYGAPDSLAYQGVHEVDHVTGSAVLIKRSVLEDVGLFDEDFFWMHEDIEYSCRAKRRDWRLMVNLDAKVWHKVGATLGEEPKRTYFATKNRFLLVHKRANRLERLLFYGAFAGHRFFKFLWLALTNRFDIIRAELRALHDYRRGLYGPADQAIMEDPKWLRT